MSGIKDITLGTLGKRDSECYFIPEQPYEFIRHEESRSHVRVKCKAICQGSLLKFCSCYNTDECVGRWHLVEKITTGKWIPCNKVQFNHSGKHKWIHEFYPNIG
ncbi:MAG: hypothetical protein LBC86_09145 [Oscillospiraceae bacterium]|nr:hypothetical protein [Oscillospiraceae bacterium]